MILRKNNIDYYCLEYLYKYLIKQYIIHILISYQGVDISVDFRQM